MPELPEVETIRRQLVRHVEGRTIVFAEILDPRWTMPEPPGAVEQELRGAEIERLWRSGKYLIWQLSGDRHLITHLRMTGAILFDPDPEPLHARVRLELDSGHRLVFDDPRRFGTGHLVHGSAARDAYLDARVGIEPFSPRFTAAHLLQLTRGRRAPIKAFVLDQRRIAGVGNIYADEALFRARIHPLRPAGRLRRADLERLREGIEDALAGWDRRQGRLDRRLPPHRRCAWRVPGQLSDPPPRRRALSSLRFTRGQARGRGQGNLRVRALPATSAGRRRDR